MPSFLLPIKRGSLIQLPNQECAPIPFPGVSWRRDLSPFVSAAALGAEGGVGETSLFSLPSCPSRPVFSRKEETPTESHHFAAFPKCE